MTYLSLQISILTIVAVDAFIAYLLTLCFLTIDKFLSSPQLRFNSSFKHMKCEYCALTNTTVSLPGHAHVYLARTHTQGDRIYLLLQLIETQCFGIKGSMD